MSSGPGARQQFPPRGCCRCERRTRSKELIGIVDAGLVEGSHARPLELSWRANTAWAEATGHTYRRSAPGGGLSFEVRIGEMQAEVDR
jgi:hypothetical protein